MRWVSFFVLSLALHTAALLFPIAMAAPGVDPLVRVTILPTGGKSGGAKGAGALRRRPGVKKAIRPAPVSHPTSAKDAYNQEPQTFPVKPLSKSNKVRVSSVSAAIASADNHGMTSDAAGIGFPSAGEAGDEDDFFGTSSAGSGYGNGNGSDAFPRAAVLTLARYRNTPRPEYPESARRQGREGKVLLRVLVDDQGRSKKVEIHTSSGSEALDQAAADAIQRWRFYPARYGDRPVESWIKVPIEFALAHTGPR